MKQESLKFSGRASNPATKKFSPAQIAAQRLFAERARAGTLGKGTKRKANPVTKMKIERSETPDNPEGIVVTEAGALRFARQNMPSDLKKAGFVASVFPGARGWVINYGKAVKRNPDKAKPRAYVKRVSQATGAPPSKRLVTRRKKALTAPAGYFPNPKVKYTNRAKDMKGDQRVGYAVHMADRPSYQAIAWFTKKDDAVKVAQEASDRTGKQLAVTRVQNYFGAM